MPVDRRSPSSRRPRTVRPVATGARRPARPETRAVTMPDGGRWRLTVVARLEADAPTAPGGRDTGAAARLVVRVEPVSGPERGSRVLGLPARTLRAAGSAALQGLVAAARG